MARVTVEDCLARVQNRFALTVLASRRARALCDGHGTPMIECNNKQAVTALREVADGRVRYIEDVASVMNGFIQEQRASLRGDDNDNTFLETVPFSSDGEEDDDDGDDTVEELTSDLHTLSTKKEKDDDDDDDSREASSTSNQESEGVSDMEDSSSSDSDTSDDGDDNELDGSDLDLDDPGQILSDDEISDDGSEDSDDEEDGD
ncbi:MAG: DNA-directed RNA polymerase subunit omega [Myxococcales bacterium FL481]|nr:MAG: DNA-directed RNA polymerase subunit omega [Myxococcales bacterium FL481]